MKNPFEEEFKEKNQPKEIQKAEIFGALKNYNTPMMVKKTGKEIKQQINDVILPYLATKQEEIQTKLTEFLSGVTVLPTHPCWTKIELSESEFPYKQYSWEETNFVENQKSVGLVFKGFGDIEGDCPGCGEEIKVSPYYPQSKEEAEARRNYNIAVEDYRDLIMDIKTANVLLKSLKDEDDYYLNIEQLVGLKFDE